MCAKETKVMWHVYVAQCLPNPHPTCQCTHEYHHSHSLHPAFDHTLIHSPTLPCPCTHPCEGYTTPYNGYTFPGMLLVKWCWGSLVQGWYQWWYQWQQHRYPPVWVYGVRHDQIWTHTCMGAMVNPMGYGPTIHTGAVVILRDQAVVWKCTRLD